MNLITFILFKIRELLCFKYNLILFQSQTPAPYGQGYGTTSVQPTSTMYPVQQQPVSAANPFAGQNMYPVASVAKPVSKPYIPTVVPPKPFSPGPAVSQPPLPHPGFVTPSQPQAPPAPPTATSAQPG